MGKLVKWLIGIVLFLLVLIIITPLILPVFINPNNYKETITRKVQEQTGRTLAIPGDINLDFSLIGLKTVFEMGEVSLSSNKDFPDTEFFVSRHAEIDLALWPLIKEKELQINRIDLEGVSINLVKNEQGVGSWEDLTGRGQAAPKKEKPPESTVETETGLASIDIGGIQAKDINLTYTDRQANRAVSLSNLNLDIGRIRQRHPFPLQANFELLVKNENQQPVSAKINTSGNFSFTLADKLFSVDDFHLEGLVMTSSLPDGKLDFEVAANINLALDEQKIDVKKLIFKHGNMEMKTMLSIEGFANPLINGSLRIPPFSPREQAKAFGITLPVEDPQSLASMAAQLDFAGNLDKLKIDNIQLNLDETNIDGVLLMTNVLQPAYDFTFRIDQLDLDKYLPAKKKKTSAEPFAPREPAAVTPAVSTEAGPVLPVEQLKKLTFNAHLHVGRLKAAKLTVTNIQVQASGRGGLIKLDPLAADVYDGTLTVTADIDARPDTPEVALVKDLKGVQMGPLFLDLSGKEEIKGRADIHVDLTTRGSTKDELVRNSNGRMNLSLVDGEIAKLKIIDTIRMAKALLGSQKDKEEGQNRESVPAGSASGQTTASGRSTAFANLTASGVITNGVFANNDLLARSELMKVEGKGTVDFVRETIDYLLTIYLAKTIDRNEETGLVDLAETPIPYRVKGTFDHIKQSAALEQIIKSEAKKLLMKELEKQFDGDKKKEGEKQESQDSTKDLINKGLKSLFGN